MRNHDKEKVRNSIRRNYSEIARREVLGGCCCTGGCCGGNTAEDIRSASKNIGYTEEDLSEAVKGTNMGLGCGNPVALAALKEGETVLDLGCGGGFDCFLARKQVGETGYVIGVDMTPDMISLARKNSGESGYTNVEFRLGEIEHLPVGDEAIDVILSNCVINLSPDKEQVFWEAFRVLKPGGRLSITDVVAMEALPEEIRTNQDYISGCIGQAADMEDIRAMLIKAGFQRIEISPKENSRDIIRSWVPDTGLEEFVASCLIAAVKPDKQQ